MIRFRLFRSEGVDGLSLTKILSPSNPIKSFSSSLHEQGSDAAGDQQCLELIIYFRYRAEGRSCLVFAHHLLSSLRHFGRFQQFTSSLVIIKCTKYISVGPIDLLLFAARLFPRAEMVIRLVTIA